MYICTGTITEDGIGHIKIRWDNFFLKFAYEGIDRVERALQDPSI